MSRVGNRWRVCVLGSLCALLGSASGVLADRTPPPQAVIRLLSSKTCPMPALQRALAVQSTALRDCLLADYSSGKATLRCSFDEAGTVSQCSVASVEGRVGKDKQSCLQKTLSKLSVSKDAWTGLRPSECVAQITAELRRTPHRRPVLELFD